MTEAISIPAAQPPARAVPSGKPALRLPAGRMRSPRSARSIDFIAGDSASLSVQASSGANSISAHLLSPKPRSTEGTPDPQLRACRTIQSQPIRTRSGQRSGATPIPGRTAPSSLAPPSRPGEHAPPGFASSNPQRPNETVSLPKARTRKTPTSTAPPTSSGCRRKRDGST